MFCFLCYVGFSLRFPQYLNFNYISSFLYATCSMIIMCLSNPTLGFVVCLALLLLLTLMAWILSIPVFILPKNVRAWIHIIFYLLGCGCYRERKQRRGHRSFGH